MGGGVGGGLLAMRYCPDGGLGKDVQFCPPFFISSKTVEELHFLQVGFDFYGFYYC